MKGYENMKFKTLSRLLTSVMLVTVLNSVVATMIIMYAYGAFVDFFEAPFAIIFAGVIAVLVTITISYVFCNTLINAYKASQKEQRRKR